MEPPEDRVGWLDVFEGSVMTPYARPVTMSTMDTPTAWEVGGSSSRTVTQEKALTGARTSLLDISTPLVRNTEQHPILEAP
jgi:hypothetical protein